MSDDKNQAAGEVPSAIGRYQITGTLGFGAMGAVYRAFDPLIKRTLAIKTIRLDIPRQSPQHQAFIERFYQEARISGTLSHPSIVTLFDIGEENGVPFLAMELVDGKTIGAILEEGTRFKPEKVIGLVSQVAAALDYAHSRGVVHRDIKPSNLIVHEADKVKVTDFGIAKLADSEITHSGALLGTPSYMSPEQAMGEKLDGRSDIFSLGVVAFEMLSGQQPFPGANVTSILYRLVHVDPVEPANLEMNGLVPQKWREVFHKVLAKKAESRYQTASAFVQDLEYCLGAWFTGLGDEETISLQMPVPDETTVTIPRMAAPAVPAAARGDGSPAAESDTLVLPGPPPAEDDEPDTTLVLVEEPPQEETVLLPAARAIEDLVPGPTVVMAPPAGSQTLPPEPTVRDLAPPTARRARRPGSACPWAGPSAAWPPSRPWPSASWAGPCGSAPRRPPPAPAATATLGSGRRGHARPAPVAPLPTLGALRVESEPPGARVRVNGQAKGQTPLRLAELPFGAYEVRVEQKGYEAQTRAVSLDAGSPSAEVRVALARPAAPASGAADILSTPSGAAVSVDGRPVGTHASLRPEAQARHAPDRGRPRRARDLDRFRGRGGGRDGARRGAPAGHRETTGAADPGAGRHRARLREHAGRGGRPGEEALGQLAVVPFRSGRAPEVGRAGVGPGPHRGQRDRRGAGRLGGGVRREGGRRRRRVRGSPLEVPAGDEAGHAREGPDDVQADVPRRVGDRWRS